MSETAASAKHRSEEVDGLRSAVAEVAGELKRLNSRVRDLAEAVEALGPDRPVSGANSSGPASRREPSAATACHGVLVTVQPLPELAMAAMVETSLRSLPAVKRVISVERIEDRARFKLEAATDADLISEMRAALPVSFRVVESTVDEVSLELKWLWGTDS